MAKGLLITFEGPNGVGKTLQTSLLRERLEKLGIPVVSSREPGGVLIAEQIREYLISLPWGYLPPEQECELYYIGRSETLKQLVIPHLEAGHSVILDRFEDSTVVYQGILGGVSQSFLKRMSLRYMMGVRPDLTVFLDAPYQMVKGRLETQLATNYDPADEFNEASYEKLRQAYYTHFHSKDSNRYIVVDSRRSIETVSEVIFNRTKGLIESKYGKEGIPRKIER